MFFQRLLPIVPCFIYHEVINEKELNFGFQAWRAQCPCSLTKRNNSTQGHGISWASPRMSIEQLLKATLSSECLTQGFGQSRKVSMIKDLVHLQKDGKAFVKNCPISLTTNKYLYNHHILTYMHININIYKDFELFK